ncbi:virulence-associated E family protein [Leuconostoc lactis]|uniref:virulence-associated E family protein n=1 Tax=Leuconostoc lactis TaxID=1246 RepID=UPI0011BB69E1|nr:virulence-associated E family protein [Leuconostoc lactis]QEA50861.1 virulence protein E [Leuconostoc lactis]
MIEDTKKALNTSLTANVQRAQDDSINSNYTTEPTWHKRFVKNKNGTIKENVIGNITLIFNHDKLFAGKFRYNEFTGDNEITENMIISAGKIKAGIIEDVAEYFIIEYIQRVYGFTVRPELIYQAFVTVSRLNPYNPVVDYFNEAEKAWDGEKRIDTFLSDFLGAPKNDVTALVTRLFLTGTVSKAYNPLGKFDFVLDLVGDQGTGKTTLLKKLGGDWYVDTVENFKDKDEYSKMLRALIVNDDEMKATNVSSFQSLKRFVTLTELEFRKPYERHPVRYQKHFTLARTTNEIDYLKDKTGSRRFLPIRVSKENQTKHPVKDLSNDIVKQIWGEAVHYYKQNGVPYPNEEQLKLLEKAREHFEYVDEVENQINVFLDNRIENWVASSDIAFGLEVENLATNRSLAQKIKYIMDNKQGWRSGRKGNKRVWWKE